MEIIPYGAAKEVTGSCFSLKTGKESILIDCGMFQGDKQTEKLNYLPFGFTPKDYSTLLLTHAHLDHSGRIPLLVKQGFKGVIYSTSATKDLAYVVLMDAAKIASHDTENENKRRAEQGLPAREPIYTEKEVNESMKLFKTLDYGKKIKISNNISAVFYDAGHILGAASIQLEVKEGNKATTVVFSGDIGQEDVPIVRDPEPIEKADYVFIESTYGDRLHPPIEERKNKFLDIIRATYGKGGILMIPSFAIERAQEVLYTINEFVEKGLMPKMDVYLDSPMAIKATEAFKKHPECYDDEIKSLLETGDNPFTFPGLTYSKTVDDSKKINEITYPIIIIAGSGMCTAGRIKHHIKHRISDPKNTILFVGYQAEGTLGYWIKKGEKKIRLLGHEILVNADVESIDSFSGHADYKGLLNWLKYISPKPKKAFIIHGSKQSTLAFSGKVEKAGIKAYIPDVREKISLYVRNC